MWVEIVVSDCCDSCFAALRPGMITMFENGHMYCKSCVEKGKHHGKRKIFNTEEIEINPIVNSGGLPPVRNEPV